MTWAVAWEPQAHRELRRLDRQTQQRIVRAIDRLATTQYGNIRRLSDPALDADYRLKVGAWRVLFNRDRAAQTLIIIHVLPRASAYD